MTYDEDGCLALVGAVTQAALKELGPGWVLTPDGLAWCRRWGLNPLAVYKTALIACREWRDEEARRVVAQLHRRRPRYGS